MLKIRFMQKSVHVLHLPENRAVKKYKHELSIIFVALSKSRNRAKVVMNHFMVIQLLESLVFKNFLNLFQNSSLWVG